jgi:hypothetical protein
MALYFLKNSQGYKFKQTKVPGLDTFPYGIFTYEFFPTIFVTLHTTTIENIIFVQLEVVLNIS